MGHVSQVCQTDSKRLTSIDCAKGIAMISVIAGHLGDGNINRVVFGYHLTVFFLISGYTFRKKEFNSKFVSGKFSRLMCPYFYTCLAVMVSDILNSILIGVDGRRITILTSVISKDLLRTFFASGTRTDFATLDIGVMIGAVWFFPAMFFSLIFIQWLINYTDNKIKQYAITSVVAILSYISAQFIWLPFSIQSGMFCALFVLIGMNLRTSGYLNKLHWKHYIIMIIVSILGTIQNYTMIYYVTNTVSDLIISLIVTLCFSLLILKFAQWMSQKTKVLMRIFTFVGKNSVIYLCVHLWELDTAGYWQGQFLSMFSLSEDAYIWAIFGVKITLITLVTLLILGFQRWSKKSMPVASTSFGKRVKEIDIMCGGLIILMIIGHFNIDANLRKMIYSFHMMAFVLLSGYFYKKSSHFLTSFKKMVRSFLIPYGVCCVLSVFVIDRPETIYEVGGGIRKYLLAMSYSKNILSDVPSIGPVYFLLLLFLVRLLYCGVEAILDRYLLEKKQKNIYMPCLILAFSIVGMYLGKYGWWLPWSLDIALYSIIFYWIGTIFRKKDVLNWCYNNPWVYFVLSIIWVYMIYVGSMEISIRAYEPYGIVILGSVSGILLFYMLCKYMERHWNVVMTELFAKIGNVTLYILVFHKLFDGIIRQFWNMYFDPEYIYHMAACVGTQVAIPTLMYYLVVQIRKRKERVSCHI